MDIRHVAGVRRKLGHRRDMTYEHRVSCIDEGVIHLEYLSARVTISPNLCSFEAEAAREITSRCPINIRNPAGMPINLSDGKKIADQVCRASRPLVVIRSYINDPLPQQTHSLGGAEDGAVQVVFGRWYTLPKLLGRAASWAQKGYQHKPEWKQE